MNSNDRAIALRLIKIFSGTSKFYITRNIQSLGLTRQTIQNKIKLLREQEIIENITINIQPYIQPNNLKYVILEIKTNPREPKIVEQLLKIPHLKMLDGIFGEFSLIALFVFKSLEDYYDGLEKIDTLMAESYFKKYQIIEVLRVFKTNSINLDQANYDSDFNIDKNDYLILKILQEEQTGKPISTYEIRDKMRILYNVDLSQSTIHNRIKKLEKKGIILNYSINFSPKKIGYEGKFILRLKPKDPSKYNELALKLEVSHFITDLFRIGEEHGLFAIVRVKKIGDYANFIRDLYISEEIEDTYTNFVLDELKPYTNFSIF
ncbi:MAG: Lrp/AsnC family transcriptional regulator [Promethearchaeota archaeon]|nr:MAG: Lrp/AsnC family transcriptional regulator [Candidatus Lokiarchaeota archaeon]